MNTPMAVVLGVVLAGVPCLPRGAWAQMSPPPGSLTLPSAAGSRPAERPTAAPVPVPAPRAPVQRVAPMASPVPPAGSSLGRAATPKPPVVSPRPHSAPQKPAAGKPAAGKAAVVGGAVAGGAVAGAAAATVAKPGAAKPAEAKPAEAKSGEAKPEDTKPEDSKAPEQSKGTVTGQKLPRWAGILYDGVKLRVGPGTRYPVDWIYRRPDQPVRVLREFETWRLIEDNEGVKGWVHQSNLTGRRSFMVPNARTLRRSAAEDAAAVAVLQPGVVGRVRGCAAEAAWCEVRVGDYRGWLKRDGLWGVSPGEAVGN